MQVTELSGRSVFWSWPSTVSEDPGCAGTFSETSYRSGDPRNLLTKEIAGPGGGTQQSVPMEVTRGKSLPCLHGQQLAKKSSGLILTADTDRRTERPYV